MRVQKKTANILINMVMFIDDRHHLRIIICKKSELYAIG